MAITNKHLDYLIPFYEIYYHLDKEMLNYAISERDLGVFIDHKLCWTNHCENTVDDTQSKSKLKF